MDTEEMYRRGVADAERGEPHPFYYQHYYQYRRAYDRARRSRGLPGGYYDQRQRFLIRAAAVVATVAVALGGFLLWRGRSELPATAQGNGNQSAIAANTTQVPTRTPVFATPTVPPTPTPLALRAGGTAEVVNVGAAVLRGRKQPMLTAAATAAFKQGDRVSVLEGPVEADGFTWWRIEGSAGAGWSAQQAQDGTPWLQAVAP